jgi:RND family efflux transporter MFP subunit
LARLDANDLQLALQAAADQRRAAEVDAVQATSDAQRFRRLMAEGSMGAADTERQQAHADAAAARLKQAERQLDLARNRAGYTTLTAPFDGVVTGLRFEAGQMVSEGQGVLSLAQPGELDVVVDVPEDLVDGLKRWRATAVFGSDATTATTAAAAAANKKPTALRLRELAPSANPASRTSRARFTWSATKDSPTPHLGMTAMVRLQRPGSEPTADLPLGALLTTPAGPSVWTVDAATGALKQLPVQLVSQTTDRVRLAGLKDGLLVVSAGAQKLDAGLKVRPVPRPLAQALPSERAQ